MDDMISDERKAELRQLAQGKSFNLPQDVHIEKMMLPNGRKAYVFRHDKMGELGRLLILPHPSGQSQFMVEVSGSEDDPMSTKRRALLEPVAKNVLDTMGSILGHGEGELAPYTTPTQSYRIPIQEVPCEHCHKTVALLVFAADALSADRLEDYARMMYDKVKSMDVPTWIIGTETEEVKIGDEVAGKSLVLKIWPKRIEAQMMLSSYINAELDKLIAMHCKKNRPKNR